MQYYGMGFSGNVYQSQALRVMKNDYQKYQQRHINSTASFRPQVNSNNQGAGAGAGAGNNQKDGKKQQTDKQKQQLAE